MFYDNGVDMDNNIAIKVEHLSKIYKIFNNPVDRLKETLNPFHKRYSKDFYALNDVSFEVKKGEIIGIIGKNGAGKSTLLKILTGVVMPSSGDVKVNGRIASLLELGAGFNPEMTGIENIYLNGTVMGYSKKEMDNRLEDIVHFADIGDFIKQPVKMYSSGMFARLAFSVNAFVEPDILIVDEALSVGDNLFQIKCMNKMSQLMKDGTTILLVSHDVNAIRRFCTRVIWMMNGKLKANGAVNKIIDKYINLLKIGTNIEKDKFVSNNKYNEKSAIAHIVDFSIMDENNDIIETVTFNRFIKIKVMYEVNRIVDKPVIGIALKSINNEYICGLNSLLDSINISFQLGINEVILEYPQGLMVNGGQYYFDVALFEKTATVPIQYISRIKLITVEAEYPGEGVVILPHKWDNLL